MKKCTNCRESKGLSEFYKQKVGKYGFEARCKVCRVKSNKKKTKTKEGKLKVIYYRQVQKSKERSHEPPNYTLKEFIDRFINNDLYLYLYCNWVVSGYNTDYSPSFDRKDDYKGYSFDNIQIMYWFENKTKGHLDCKEGRNNKKSKAVIGVNIETSETIEFYSASEAGRNDFNRRSICACCNGERNKHKGYIWEYKN